MEGEVGASTEVAREEAMVGDAAAGDGLKYGG